MGSKLEGGVRFEDLTLYHVKGATNVPELSVKFSLKDIEKTINAELDGTIEQQTIRIRELVMSVVKDFDLDRAVKDYVQQRLDARVKKMAGKVIEEMLEDDDI